jgi:hypothetical protein
MKEIEYEKMEFHKALIQRLDRINSNLEKIAKELETTNNLKDVDQKYKII